MQLSALGFTNVADVTCVLSRDSVSEDVQVLILASIMSDRSGLSSAEGNLDFLQQIVELTYLWGRETHL